jgi:hypothetical protein
MKGGRFLYILLPLLTQIYSIKEGLGSGETLVPGDRWPAFLYVDATCHEDDSWRGLLRSQLLIQVSQWFAFLLLF